MTKKKKNLGVQLAPNSFLHGKLPISTNTYVIFQALALLRQVVLASARRNQQRSKSEIERSEELTRVEREHLSEEKSGRLSTIESTGTLGADDELDIDLDESCSDSEDVFEQPQ